MSAFSDPSHEVAALRKRAFMHAEELDALHGLLKRAQVALLGMSTIAWKAQRGHRGLLVFAANEEGAKALGAIALGVLEADVRVIRALNQDRCNALLLDNEEETHG